MCSSSLGDDGGGGSGMKRMLPNSNTIIAPENFPGIALSQAINIATNEMEMVDESKNDLRALILFYEILVYGYNELSDERTATTWILHMHEC